MLGKNKVDYVYFIYFFVYDILIIGDDMKRMVNYIFLLVICLLPVMVDAKANVEFEKGFDLQFFLYQENGKSFLYDMKNSNPDNGGILLEYNSTNDLINEHTFTPSENASVDEYKPLIEYYKNLYPVFKQGTIYDTADKEKIYAAHFYDDEFSIYDIKSGAYEYVDFDEDLDFTKKTLGKSYGLYKVLDGNASIIQEYGDYFVVDYFGENLGDFFVGVFDDEYKEIIRFRTNYYFDKIIYIHDELIYVMETINKIDIYNLDGEKLQTITLSDPYINPCIREDEDEDESSPVYMRIINNDLFITYFDSGTVIPRRLAIFDAEEYVGHANYVSFFTVKYSINFDVKPILSSNGDFTYEFKEEKDGKPYVELKITPKDGYSVEDIIVTDVNGNEIEVTDNKFYMPLNDVTVEVKYVQGEYLPIPDTFLSKSVTVIFIGLVLISLGFYTINYVRQE